MKNIISTIFIMMSFMLSAQEDAARNMVNKTETSIYKAQKEIMAGHVQSKPAELSFAIRYQEKAVETFKAGDFSRAMCYSSISRQYALEILSGLDKEKLAKIKEYFSLTQDENELINKHNYLNEITENKRNISTDLIDNSSLVNPEILRNNYKISLN